MDRIIVFVGSLNGKHFFMKRENILDYSQIKTYDQDHDQCLLKRGDQYILFNSYDQLTIFKEPIDIINYCFMNRFIYNNQEEEERRNFNHYIKFSKLMFLQNHINLMNMFEEDKIINLEENSSEYSPLFHQALLMTKNPKILKSIVNSSIESYYFTGRLIETFHIVEHAIEFNFEYLLSGERLKLMMEIFNGLDSYNILRNRTDIRTLDHGVQTLQLNLEKIETKLNILLNGRSIQGKDLVRLIEDISNDDVLNMRSNPSEDRRLKIEKHKIPIENCYYSEGRLYMSVTSLYGITLKTITFCHAPIDIDELNEYINRGYVISIDGNLSDEIERTWSSGNKNKLIFKRT